MRRRPPPPWALTALLALLYVATAPPTTDLAAQQHRIAVARDGAWLYDLSWFGGHHLPGYSVLLPVLGLVLGATTIGALSAVAASWAFARLARGAWSGRGGTVAAWWFAAGVGGLLFTGRMTFVLGAAVALATLVVARGRTRRPDAAPGLDAGGRHASGPHASGPATSRPGPRRARVLAAAAGAALTALASPVAALFLALAAGAWWLGAPGPRTATSGRPAVALVVAAVAFVAAVALAAAFPTGGSEPFVASALWPAIVVLAVVVVVLPADACTLRIGVVVYLLAVLASGLLPTPMGGNATRLAALAGGPLLAGALWGRRPVALGLLALPFLYWQWYPPVRDASQAWADRSAPAAYWTPVRDALEERLRAAPTRVEVPPTARRGEVRRLGPGIPLARGWIRQLDRRRNGRFYADLRPEGAGPLTGAEYRRWLDDEAVGWVALSDAAPDEASRAEDALLRAGRVPGLRRAWSNAHWTLWRVERARPLAAWAPDDAHRPARRGDDGRDPADAGPPTTGPGATTRTKTTATTGAVSGAAPRVARAAPGTLTIAVPRAGLVAVRVRTSPYLRATAHTTGARACVARDPGGWTLIRTTAPATVVLGTRLAVPWRQPPRSDCTP